MKRTGLGDFGITQITSIANTALKIFGDILRSSNQSSGTGLYVPAFTMPSDQTGNTTFDQTPIPTPTSTSNPSTPSAISNTTWLILGGIVASSVIGLILVKKSTNGTPEKQLKTN